MTDDARVAWVRIRDLVLEGDRRRVAAQELGMSFQRIKALRHIAAGERAHHELAAYLETDKPYTSVIIRDLLDRGLASVRPHPKDGRSKLVCATAAGAALAERAGLILTEPPPAMRALAPADLAELNRILGLLGPG